MGDCESTHTRGELSIHLPMLVQSIVHRLKIFAARARIVVRQRASTGTDPSRLLGRTAISLPYSMAVQLTI